MNGCRSFAATYPEILRLDLCGIQRKGCPGIATTGWEFIQEIVKIFDALFLDQDHEPLHSVESGAANMFSPNGTT